MANHNDHRFLLLTPAAPPPRRSVGAQLRLLQLLDSSFPCGGFAHSGGLEAAHRAGRLPAGDAGALDVALSALVASSLALLLPFCLAAHAAARAAATARDPEACESDEEEEEEAEGAAERSARAAAAAAPALSARLAPLVAELGAHHAAAPVARRAALAAGPALVRAASAAFPSHIAPLLAAMACSPLASAGPVPGAIALGAVVGLIGVTSPPDCGAALLHATLRDAVSAATRLGVVGPMGAAGAHARAAAAGGRTLRSALRDGTAFDVASAAGCNPLADVLQAGHDALFARLFQS